MMNELGLRVQEALRRMNVSQLYIKFQGRGWVVVSPPFLNIETSKKYTIDAVVVVLSQKFCACACKPYEVNEVLPDRLAAARSS